MTQTRTQTTIMLGDRLRVDFHRTTRVPRERGRTSELPASLGRFPLYSVRDYQDRVPGDWHPDGWIMPIWAQEAMWINFGNPLAPVALLVGAGMVNAVTGERLAANLTSGGYLTVPPQPWLDGFKPTQGEQVFQFVAAELGSGETAEEQILGTSEFGGLQFALFDPLPGAIIRPKKTPPVYDDIVKSVAGSSLTYGANLGAPVMRGGAPRIRRLSSMGLGAGGAIKQKIYPDSYLQGRPIDQVWKPEPTEKARIYMIDARQLEAITGFPAPPSPVTYEEYQRQGLPWFGLEDGGWGDVEGGSAIDTLKPVSESGTKAAEVW